MLNSPAACERYINTHTPAEIARQLRLDQERCRNGRMPSLLAFALPKSSTLSGLADEIALRLLDENGGQRGRNATTRTVSTGDIRRLEYEGVIGAIKAHVDQLNDGSDEGQGHVNIEKTVPSASDFAAALKVLEYFQASPQVAKLQSTSTFPEIITAVKTQLALPHELRLAYRTAPPLHASRRKGRKKCYICRLRIIEPHVLYSSLCKPCGGFNLAESSLSMPGSLNMAGKTSLVTGGRVALGFQTALRLLRCGARVIVTSRYPRDAESRYEKEHDFDDWSGRLRIVGADFRAAKDVFRLVATVRQILDEWGAMDGNTALRLDVLVNNAAQTLTDTLTSEKKAVEREIKLLGTNRVSSLVLDECLGYNARIRGGTSEMTLEMNNESGTPTTVGTDADLMKIEDPDHLKGSTVPISYPSKSSWAQTMADIPYEDVITAHSVNTFVPFILCRELLFCMAPSNPSSMRRPDEASPRPVGYIINVSSREGIFEDRPDSDSKNGHHVHTNMSKAALNMLTETEGFRLWKDHRIAMNTVDPGYMSAAPEYRAAGECPIGFDDGAGRVLWPIAMGEMNRDVVWGRFLKHFGEVKVDVGKGR